MASDAFARSDGLPTGESQLTASNIQGSTISHARGKRVCPLHEKRDGGLSESG
jgi:hypothetical protein